MARGALLLVPWFFLFAHLTTKAEEPSHDNKKDLERLAAKFKFFASIDFIYDRGPDLGWWTPKEVYTDYRQILDELTVPKRDEKQVIDLLKHRDPRVRTLAMAVLFAKEDPKLLPHLARLLSDEAESFKISVPSGAGGGGAPSRKYEHQTVGEIAQAMLGLYMLGAPGGPIAGRLGGWGGYAIGPHHFKFVLGQA